MSIEVPVLEVLALADRLRTTAVHGLDAVAHLGAHCPTGDVTGALRDFLASFGTAAQALARETELLGDVAEKSALSWLTLDGALLARRGQLVTR